MDNFLGNRIKLLRKKMGITQKELAEKSGLSQPYLSLLETDKIGFSRATIEKIAKALNVPVKKIFMDDKEERLFVSKIKVGRKIKYYRKKAGLTQKELAKKVGISQNYISVLENDKTGISSVSSSVLTKIASALGTTVDKLCEEGMELQKSLIDHNYTSFLESLFSDPDFIIHFSAYQDFKSLPEGEQKDILRKVLEGYKKALEEAKKNIKDKNIKDKS